MTAICSDNNDYRKIITNKVIRETLDKLFNYYDLGPNNSIQSILSFVFLRTRTRRNRNKELISQYNLVLKMTYPDLYDGFKL
jgi:hypothetical protein